MSDTVEQRQPASNTGRLPLIQKVGYGAGDFGFNLFFTTAQLFLLFYYTDVMGLPAATAGWVFAAALIWDAIIDPVMGYLANKTKTRWGRYRPYLLFGAIPISASWAIMFIPVDFTGTALVLFAVATHILFRTCYTVISMPYLALSAAITPDSNERGVLAGYRMLFAAACGLLSAFFTLQLVETFGGGREGFMWVAILYGFIATAVFLFTFSATREQVEVMESEPPAVPDIIRMMRTNKPFWLVSGAMLAGSISGTIFGKFLPYHFKYALDAEPMIGPALAIITGVFMLSIPFWTMLMKRTSKRTVWISAAVINLIAMPIIWLTADSVDTMLPVMALSGIGTGGTYLSFWAMMPDTVEYGEWKSGVRAEGGIFGIVTFIQKAALGLAAALVGEMLSAVGYIANQPQGAETLDAIKLMMIGLPIIFNVLVLLIVSRYPLDRETHGQLLADLEERDKDSATVQPA